MQKRGLGQRTPARLLSPSEGSASWLGPSPDTHHPDRQPDQVSTASNLEWEEPVVLGECRSLHQDHLVVLALGVGLLLLLGTQGGSQVLEALVHFPGEHRELRISWDPSHTRQEFSPPQPEPFPPSPLSTLTS